MRKSEADHLLDVLQNTHEGDLKLTVANLDDLGFDVPDEEHPFFVVGVEAGEEETSRIMRKITEKFEVVAWDESSEGWSVKKVKSWQIECQTGVSENLYIYDTRSRKFVPPEQFYLPPRSQ